MVDPFQKLNRHQQAIEIERVTWRQVEIPMRDPIRQRRSGNFDRNNISAPGLAAIPVQTATPDPFDWLFVT
jgi:hypothetical protein